MLTRTFRLVAATLLGVAAGAVVTVGPAAAAACSAGSGVTVVVGSQVSCDSNGGSPASSNFKDAGHSLTYVQRQPGFVCQVDGYPDTSCVNTPPADKYWGLFWSDGKSGKWTYASAGVGSTKVPTGGWVAFVFQNGDGKKYPGVTPIGPAASKPKPKPPTAAAPRPTSGATGAAEPTTAAAEKAQVAKKKAANKAANAKKARAAKDKAEATPSAAESSDAPATDEQVESAANQTDGSGSLVWVAAALVLVLVGGMAAAVWQRRTRAGRQP